MLILIVKLPLHTKTFEKKRKIRNKYKDQLDWRTGFIHMADEASPPADEANLPVNEASQFGPYIFTKLATSFFIVFFSPCFFMPKR